MNSGDQIPDGLIGTTVWCLHPYTLMRGAELVREMDGEMLAVLFRGVRSGEHLAAIWLAALFGTAPSAVDRGDGTPDLVFDVPDVGRFTGLDVRERTAFEVKSLAGNFRKWDAELDRAIAAGREPRQASASQAVESMELVLPTCEEMAERAARQFGGPEADSAQQAFIVVHPFERLTVEAVAEFPMLAPAMRSFKLPDDVSAVWLYWWPQLVTVWSRSLGAWARQFSATADEHFIDRSSELYDAQELIQRAEQHMFALLDDPPASPFHFGW